MKIGIMTFHNVTNYGAVLQCYAFQKKLQHMGYDAEVIDYQNLYFKKFYSPFYIEKRNIRKICYMLYAWPQKMIKNHKFRAFVKKYIKTSDNSYDRTNIHCADTQYDICFTGSDQVWNLGLTDGDKSYLLDFVKNGKRVSYAASFGFEKMPETLADTYVKELKAYDCISVREESGQKIVSQLMGRESTVQIDPVFLLNKKQWSELIKEVSNGREQNYICVYRINKSDCYKVAQNLRKETGLPVIVINGDKTCPGNFRRKQYCSPIDFLQLISNAKYVVTDSFHGTSFSILLNKQFIVCLDQRKDNRNTRLTNVLKMFNLDNRIQSEDVVTTEDFCQIDYDVVNDLIEKKRAEAEQYLNAVISGVDIEVK